MTYFCWLKILVQLGFCIRLRNLSPRKEQEKLFEMLLLVAALILGKTEMELGTMGDEIMAAHLAGASYCFSNSIVDGKKYKWQCRHHCDVEETKGTEIYDYIYNSDYSVVSLITFNEEKKVIAASFRGTLWVNNMIQDAKMYMASLKGNLPSFPEEKNADAKAHWGFLQSYLAVRQQVMTAFTALIEKYPDYELYFTGHSMGAAIAQIASLDALFTFPEAHKRIRNFSFHSTRVGNLAYVKLLDFDVFRFTHSNDLVSQQPSRFWFGYTHPEHDEFWQLGNKLYRCQGRESNECNNSYKIPSFNMATHLVFLSVRFHPFC